MRHKIELQFLVGLLLGGDRQRGDGLIVTVVLGMFVGILFRNGDIKDGVEVNVLVRLARCSHAIGILEAHASDEQFRVAWVGFVVKPFGIDSQYSAEDAHLLVTMVAFPPAVPAP